MVDFYFSHTLVGCCCFCSWLLLLLLFCGRCLLITAFCCWFFAFYVLLVAAIFNSSASLNVLTGCFRYTKVVHESAGFAALAGVIILGDTTLTDLCSLLTLMMMTMFMVVIGCY